MGKPENKIETYLRDTARSYGYLCYKFVSPGQAGVPDRIVIGDGIVTFVELKSETGRPSKQQLYIIDEINKRGVYATICNSKSSVDDFFRRIYHKDKNSL